MKKVFSLLATSAIALASTSAFAAFSDCKFNFGRQWASSFSSSTSFSGQGLSHLAIWLGDNATYNQYWEGYMAKASKANGLTPVIYAYVIAEYGKDNGLGDCDVTATNHCTGGANMIRNGWSSIIGRYQSYAQGLAKDFGTSDPIIWLIEPDFVQYSVTGDSLNTKYAQSGGAIADNDLAGKYFNEIVSAIKTSLPNAKIAVDISPWMNAGITTWYNRFDKSKIDYAFTSGGRTQGDNARIRSDNNNTVTWAQVSAALGGKKIIADDGYGVGGSSTTDYQEWMSTSNLSTRIGEGVIGVTIQEPASAYTTFAAANSNITVACGTVPTSSAAVSSSSVKVSSSSVVVSSSSVKVSSSSVAVSSSSVVASSSSVKVSSSSVAVPSSSSSVVVPSSSSQVVVPSSSSVATVGDWVGQNASLTNSTTTGVSIGAGADWNANRVVTYALGTVQAGTAYTLSFTADVSRGGAAMDMPISLGTNCVQTVAVSNSAATPVTCTFTASATEVVTLSLTIPGARWETLTISNLALTGPNGNVIGGGTPVISMPKFTQSKSIRIRSGALVNWMIPANANVEVFNIFGKKVMERNAVTPLDLSKLPIGLYVARAKLGNWSTARKIENQ